MTRDTASPIHIDQIAELLTPYVAVPLNDPQLTAIRTYIDLLLRWSAKLNLTAIRDPQQIVTRHFGESLFTARELFPCGDSHGVVIDIGSGAGFPGLPLKLWSENLELTLVESNYRKATFLREVIRALDLRSTVVLTERAESVSFRADLVTLRAVERFERILPTAAGLVKHGGRIAMLIGEGQVESAQSALPTVTWNKPLQIPLTRSGRLLIGTAGSS